MTRGGKRPGAGRKRGFAAFEAQKAREFIAQKVGESLEPIVSGLIKKALKGDIRATQILFDRAYGKVAEEKEFEERVAPVTQIVIQQPTGQIRRIGPPITSL